MPLNRCVCGEDGRADVGISPPGIRDMRSRVAERGGEFVLIGGMLRLGDNEDQAFCRVVGRSAGSSQ